MQPRSWTNTQYGKGAIRSHRATLKNRIGIRTAAYKCKSTHHVVVSYSIGCRKSFLLRVTISDTTNLSTTVAEEYMEIHGYGPVHFTVMNKTPFV